MSLALQARNCRVRTGLRLAEKTVRVSERDMDWADGSQQRGCSGTKPRISGESVQKMGRLSPQSWTVHGHGSGAEKVEGKPPRRLAFPSFTHTSIHPPRTQETDLYPQGAPTPTCQPPTTAPAFTDEETKARRRYFTKVTSQ